MKTQEKVSANYTYNSPTPGQITILAKTPYPVGEPSRITKVVFNTIVSCGFNAISTADTVQNTKKCFDALEGINLRLMIGKQGKNSEEMMSLVNEFHNNSILGGYELRDEPKYLDLPDVENLYDQIKSIDTKHIIQINLACAFDPNSEQGKEYLGPYSTLADYLKYFQSIFTPALWSYDFYPILLSNGQVVALTSDFYKFMQIFYNQAKDTNRPFWAYTMCMPYLTNCPEGETCNPNSPTASGRPIPTEGELRFEAFSALAYGAQGIIYWAYTQRPYNIELKENYISAPIDINGNKTEIWYRVQQVNQEIKLFNNVFYGCEVVQVSHAGKVYPGTTAFSYSMGYIKNLVTGSMGVLVSHLKNNNRHYIIIVNHDPLNTQRIKLEFINPDKVIEMSDQYDQPDEMPEDNHYLTLGPGGYALYEVW